VLVGDSLTRGRGESRRRGCRGRNLGQQVGQRPLFSRGGGGAGVSNKVMLRVCEGDRKR